MSNIIPAIGAILTFTGYTALPDGDEPILTAGQKVRVVAHGEDEAVQAEPLDGGQGDTLFFGEYTVDEVQATKATTKPKAKAAAKPKAKTKAKTPKKTKAKVKAPEAPVEAPITTIAVATPAPAPITDSATVSKLLEEQDALAAAKALALQAEETFISLGGVLSHVYNEGLHKTLGFDGRRGFAEYMLTELNIQYRKGMHLIEIYTVIRRLGIDEERAARIGWTKLREIVGKMTVDNADSLLTFAENNTREDIVDHVRTTYVNADEEGPTKVAKTRLTFNLFGENTGTVQRALAAAQETANLSTPEEALTLICAEWSQLTENVPLSYEEAKAALEARFGVSLVEQTTSTEEPGNELLETEEVAGELVEA
jgi:hypothetical protein